PQVDKGRQLQEQKRQVDKARQLLKQKRDARPDQVELWIALANLAGREDKPEKAMDILKEAEKRPKLRGSIELSLARMRHLARLPKEQAMNELKALKKDLWQLDRANRQRAGSGLGDAYHRLGDPAKAEQIWSRLAKEQPDNLGLRLKLFDLAQEANNRARQDKNRSQEAGSLARMGRIVKEIRGIERGDGAYWRYGEAFLKVQTAIQETDADKRARLLGEARGLLAEVAKRRPRWFRVPAVQGLIEQMKGQ